MKAERTKEIPGDVAHCMGCGEKWKVGDRVLAIPQAPIVVTEISPEGDPRSTYDEWLRTTRAWHAECLR